MFGYGILEDGVTLALIEPSAFAGSVGLILAALVFGMEGFDELRGGSCGFGWRLGRCHRGGCEEEGEEGWGAASDGADWMGAWCS